MPLNVVTLTDALTKLDEPEPPKVPPQVAERWFEAWWAYASEMTYFLPGPPLLAAKELAKLAFIPVLSPGCAPSPVPGAFFGFLELAIAAGWLAAGTPASLNPLYSGPIVPVGPGILTLALLATAPIGLASPSKFPVRAAQAVAIDLWTHVSMTIIPVSGPTPVPLV